MTYRLLRAACAAGLYLSLLYVSPPRFNAAWILVWGSAAGLVAVGVLMDGRR